MGKILISTQGINKILKKYTVEKAICEYIWNGFDAEANIVKINILENNIKGTQKIEIIDDGTGINYENLNKKFEPFYQSEKSSDDKVKTSKVHGRNGIGRLTFSCFANDAEWETTYSIDNNNFSYTIKINKNTLEEYEESPKIISTNKTGTKVSFFNIDTNIDINGLTEYLMLEYCWYLILYPNKSLWINGKKVDYSNCILKHEHFDLKDEETKKEYNVDYYQWEKKINDEYSRYYFLNTNGEEVFKETTTLNNKGDSFYHSVFIKGEIFDDFYVTENENENQITLEENTCRFSKRCKEFKNIKNMIDKFLRKKRKPYLGVVAEKMINSYKDEKIFPEYNEKDYIQKIKHEELEKLVAVVYEKEPKIFIQLNKEQKKTLVRLFDLIIENGDTDSLYRILNEVIELTDDERDELADILEKTALSNITKTIKLIEDRYKTIEELKKLVFDDSIKANEVDHIQKMMESYLWIFGEEYSLVTAEEPDFEEALRRYLYILNEDNSEIEIDSEDNRRQMDIFARRNVDGKTFENIVVELKHPKIRLGKKQLDQVEKYMYTILQEPRFNNHDEKWVFYLVGGEFDTSNYIENQIENVKNKGEKSLVFSVNNYKIYVKKWSEIFTELELRLNFLQEKLQIKKEKLILQIKDKTADEIVKDISKNSSKTDYDEKVIELVGRK